MRSRPQDHACDACGGSGVIRTVEDFGIYHTTTVSGCETCRGAGRISDVMPVADALADANQLREVTATLLGQSHESWVALRYGMQAAHNCDFHGQGRRGCLSGLPRTAGRVMGAPGRCDLCDVPLNPQTDTCPECGVYHGEPCSVCGQRGYHKRECAALDLPENDEAAYF